MAKKPGEAYERLAHWINQCLHNRAVIKFNDKITDKVPPIVPNRPPKIPRIIKKKIDLRDLKDEFQLYLVGLDRRKYSSNRKAILNRVQKFERPALIDGTVILLAQFLKVKKLKVMEE